MLNLKSKNIFILILSLYISGCATSFYKVSRTQELKAELRFTSDRVMLQCLKATDEDSPEERYMFLINILDDDETVLSAIQGNNSDKEDCDKRKIEVGKVLSGGTNIYLGGIGNPYRPQVIDAENYTFPKHGTFHGNGRVLQYMVIANENGNCNSAYHSDDEPCPQDGFPIDNLP